MLETTVSTHLRNGIHREEQLEPHLADLVNKHQVEETDGTLGLQVLVETRPQGSDKVSEQLRLDSLDCPDMGRILSQHQIDSKVVQLKLRK